MKTKFNIEKMTCTQCAVSVTNKLNTLGCTEINVNPITGEASVLVPDNLSSEEIANEISKLGYPSKIKNSVNPNNKKSKFGLLEKQVIISILFTSPLLLHMFLNESSILMHPYIQLSLCIPVFIIGILQFGKSAFYSLRNRAINMDILIFIGSSAAFFYSLYGTLAFYGTLLVHNYMFYETSASIITLVLLGNLMEHRSIKKTTSSLRELQKLQVEKSSIILQDNSIKDIYTKDIKIGNLLLVKTGEKIPTDGTVFIGSGVINEALLTGESIPILKKLNDSVIAGSILEDGNLKIIATKRLEDNTISKISNLVSEAQNSKPEIQKIGDKISSIFVPIVLLISLLTFIISWQIADISIQKALISSIAVLVISCPCAMGLATPTAVMVGVGKAAKKGSIIKGGDTLEKLANSSVVVFDKTGTLTTGTFEIQKINQLIDTDFDIKSVIKSLEENSSHPIAVSLCNKLSDVKYYRLFDIKEDKGIGISGSDLNKDIWSIGSKRILKNQYNSNAELFLTRNDDLIAEIWIQDEIKTDAIKMIKTLKNEGKKIIMLSGDKKAKCKTVANKLKIDEYYSEKLPNEKLTFINKLIKDEVVVMIGDGVNDAPSLTKSHVGISFGEAVDIAQNSSDIIILGSKNLSKISDIFSVSKLTLRTIKQNLFWALFYNVVAIPIAALGLLSPIIATGSMAFSDLIVIGNSIRIKYKK